MVFLKKIWGYNSFFLFDLCNPFTFKISDIVPSTPAILLLFSTVLMLFLNSLSVYHLIFPY